MCVHFVEAQVHSAQMLIGRCCTSVTASVSPSKKQVPSESLHTVDLIQLHMFFLIYFDIFVHVCVFKFFQNLGLLIRKNFSVSTSESKSKSESSSCSSSSSSSYFLILCENQMFFSKNVCFLPTRRSNLTPPESRELRRRRISTVGEASGDLLP